MMLKRRFKANTKSMHILVKEDYYNVTNGDRIVPKMFQFRPDPVTANAAKQ